MGPSAKLDDIVAHAQELLRVKEIPDYPNALNGLQLANGGDVRTIGAAVDASLAVVRQAVEARVDLLLVHHGLFWGGAQAIRGAYYEKLRLATANQLAVYSVHIPLDVHERLGNNALLCQRLGFAETEPFFAWKGILLGRAARVEMSREELAARLEAAVGGPAHLCPGGPEAVRRVGVITGGAGGEVEAVAESGIDTFITGEGPHHTFGLAEELGVNLFYAGHYATETFGVRALAEHLSSRFGLPQVFLDHPSGL